MSAYVLLKYGGSTSENAFYIVWCYEHIKAQFYGH